MGKDIKSIRATTAELSVKSVWTDTINLILRVVQVLSLRVVGQILVSAVCCFALVHQKTPYIKSFIGALQVELGQVIESFRLEKTLKIIESDC